MHLTKNDIENSERKWRLNLINSISGIKPANLIGTRSKDGKSNLAIFSSIVHLGSSPAQLGMIVRPTGEVPRHTYENILESGLYTINQVKNNFIEKAHYTSSKLDKNESEFDFVQLKEEFLDDFEAPYVQESALKMGMSLLEEIPLPNGCILIVGELEHLYFKENAINDLGQLDLSIMETAGISGLNTYYKLEKMATFPYVRSGMTIEKG